MRGAGKSACPHFAYVGPHAFSETDATDDFRNRCAFLKKKEPRFPEALKADAKHSASMTTILTIAVYA